MIFLRQYLSNIENSVWYNLVLVELEWDLHFSYSILRLNISKQLNGVSKLLLSNRSMKTDIIICLGITFLFLIVGIWLCFSLQTSENEDISVLKSFRQEWQPWHAFHNCHLLLSCWCSVWIMLFYLQKNSCCNLSN